MLFRSKGHKLPVVGALSSVVEWEVIENITEAIMEAGAVMPIARTSDWETADMVVTEAGIVVPVYAGGTEYSALTPSDAHNLSRRGCIIGQSFTQSYLAS